MFLNTFVSLAFAVYQVVSGFFVSPEVHQPRSTEVYPQSEPLPPPIQLGEITEEELKQYDGSDSKKPLLMAIKGQIYDVSQSRMFYGPGGPYALFAGKDASRALAKMSFEDNDLTGDISGLGPFELEALQDWEYKFMSKYVKVGTIQKKDAEGKESSEPSETKLAGSEEAPSTTNTGEEEAPAVTRDESIDEKTTTEKKDAANGDAAKEENKRVCVDLSCWIVELHKVNQSYCATKEKVYLRGFFHRLRALIALNCSIILVSDGSIPGIKVPTYRRRLKSRFEVAEDAVEPGKETSLKRNMGSEFSCMIKEAKDACFSSDSDIFLFGAKTVYREICLGEGGHVVCYEMEDIKKKLGLGRNSLIALALLLGSDYSQGVRGIRQQKACEIVKSVGENAILEKVSSEGLSFVKKPRNSKKKAVCSKKGTLPLVVINGSNHDPEGLEEIKEVIDAFMNPKCHPADSNTVSRALAEFSFQRTKLQEICHQFFEWTPEKTDEYILPKIAERNLRKFAILQSKSTEVGGVNFPLHKGRECFEVSWNDLNGLETSIVPADLVERACPEKIIEFKEKMEARKKKPKQKQPKSKQTETSSPDKSSSLIELSLKLQQIALSSTSVVATSTIEETEQEKEQQNPKKHNYLCLIDSPAKENSNNDWSAMDRFVGVGLSSCSLYQETEVIDLISPCPESRSRSVSRSYQEEKSHDHKLETVIELSDSETDDEEHCRKSRELRMFLENIRKDIIL
ncbi:unnamed protein product [Thlaspi arvense]|uniref:Cytochrome b5 heme-binding domain-containing protein n=1 Tax=Thlaspi arvense TaxID=13288 RepID=A0AAU9SF05_THLAR|nr:unnamed protein product [Thlaspi arvense]